MTSRAERARRRWLNDAAPEQRRVWVTEIVAGSWRDHTWVDEIVITATAVAAASGGLTRFTPINATRITLVAVLVAAVAVLWLVTPPGRAHIRTARHSKQLDRYTERRIRRHHDDQILTAAGFKPGQVHLDHVTVGNLVPDPTEETGAMSVLPVGTKPEWIDLTVSSTTKPETVADGYCKVFGYAYWEISHHETAAQQFTVTLRIYPRPKPRHLNPGDLEEFFQALCAELDLGDKEHQFPRIRPGSVRFTRTRHPEINDLDDPVLGWRPEVLAFDIIPTPLQVTADTHARIVRAVMDRLGYRGEETNEYQPETGIEVVLHRDGVPPLLPLPIADLQKRWDDVADDIFSGDKFRPRLLTVTWEGASTEAASPEDARSQILTHPRPDRVEFTFDCQERDATTVIARLKSRLAYHTVTGVYDTKHGLMVTAYRDRHPVGRRFDPTRIVDGRVPEGRNYTGDGISYWDLGGESMVGVVGATGSGKGDAIMKALAISLHLDWFGVYVSGKPFTTEAKALTGAMLRADGTNPDACAAALDLVFMEIALRGWKIDQSGGSFRHVTEYRAWHDTQVSVGNDPGLPIGADVSLVFDEPGQIVDPDLCLSGDPKQAKYASNVLAGITSKGRWTGAHVLLASQIGNYPNLGGRLVVANLTRRIQLWSLKKEDYQAFGIDNDRRALLDQQREILARNHTAAGHPGKPVTAGHGFVINDEGIHETQLDWAVDGDYLAGLVVPGWIERHPGVDPQQRRDPISELEAARAVFGECTETDLADVDHDAHPHIISNNPFKSLPDASDGLVDALDGTP